MTSQSDAIWGPTAREHPAYTLRLQHARLEADTRLSRIIAREDRRHRKLARREARLVWFRRYWPVIGTVGVFVCVVAGLALPGLVK